MIIPLDRSCISLKPTAPPELKRTDIPPAAEAYHPFEVLADFEIAELVSKNGLGVDAVNAILTGLGGCWAENSKSTFRSHGDMNAALERAREYVIPVRILRIYVCYNL